MTSYAAPLREIYFLLDEVLNAEQIFRLPGYEEVTLDLVEAVLGEAAKFCTNELLPLNLSGDKEGCHYTNGMVRTPTGFKEAYRKFVEGGWTSLACAEEFGGQGLPNLLQVVIQEMINATNMAFGMYPGLSHGAYTALVVHGSEALKQIYLPKIVNGQWSATMCLTESHCGTDLGLMRTQAKPREDGSYTLTGTKIFISAGEHDLTENIIHLVLARLPDAPAGIKGVSLFLAPKFLPNEDGSLGVRNGVMCGAIEHKMGINANATCVMNFDGAQGWLIGEAHKGMHAMFTMMNSARLGVGLQGLGISEVAYQTAVAYAKDRRQMRSLDPKKQDLSAAADLILVHPDVRRMLLTIRAKTEAGRALAYWVSLLQDVFKKHPDPDKRQEANDTIALMTPILKVLLSDQGVQAANLAIQVHGGSGYIHDYGVEQLARDARIAQIYEGTNGIQALDLVSRKMSHAMGRQMRRFFHPLSTYLDARMNAPAMLEFIVPLAKAFGKLQIATMTLAQKGLEDPEEAAAVANEYLQLFSLVALGYMWAQMAEAALKKLDGEDAAFYAAKLMTARFFTQKLLPEHQFFFSSIMAGGKALMELPAESF